MIQSQKMYTVIIRKTQREECCTATHQEGLVELKQAGELFEQLVNAVQPLQEDRTLLAHIVSILLVATAVPKLMTVVQPVNLYKHLETLWTTRYSVLKVIILQRNKDYAYCTNLALHSSNRYCPYILLPCQNLAFTLPTMQLNRNFGQRLGHFMLKVANKPRAASLKER